MRPALRSDGSVVVWGINDFGNATVPARLPSALAIAAEGSSTLALVRDPPPSLTIFRNTEQTVSLSWRGAGVLEQADNLTAPTWQPAPDQANPQTIGITEPMKFYRVKAD